MSFSLLACEQLVPSSPPNHRNVNIFYSYVQHRIELVSNPGWYQLVLFWNCCQVPPMPGHLCLLLPLLSLSAAPLDPLAGCWWLSGAVTRSAPLSASPRFLPPSAGQKKTPPLASLNPHFLPQREGLNSVGKTLSRHSLSSSQKHFTKQSSCSILKKKKELHC